MEGATLPEVLPPAIDLSQQLAWLRPVDRNG